MLNTAAALRKDKNHARRRDVLQHRHFAVIAGIVAALENAHSRCMLADHFADRLAETNSNFDRKRFLKACDCA